VSIDYLHRAATYFAPPAGYEAKALMMAAGMTPDPWQARLMEARPDRALLLCSRQAGKSMAVAAIALEQALTQSGSTVLLVSASQRQSAELLGKVRALALAQQFPIGLEAISVLSLRLSNGSRVVSLPGKAELIRGYAADLLVLDESAWVPDSLYQSVRPMLAVSHGRLIALSTPYGKRGWFYSAWVGNEPWHRTKVSAKEVPRITAEFLEEERRSLPANVFRAEYSCEFCDTVDAVFSTADVLGALSDEVEPLFGAPTSSTAMESAIVPLFPAGIAS
jgi:hypothetical protein